MHASSCMAVVKNKNWGGGGGGGGGTNYIHLHVYRKGEARAKRGSSAVLFTKRIYLFVVRTNSPGSKGARGLALRLCECSNVNVIYK